MGRRLLAIALVPYAAWLVFAYRYHFLDGVNLAFHEAGHLAFAFLGQTLHVLGGTLGQLVFPVACGVHFLREGRRFEAAVCGFWLGESLMYVAVYMADAQAMALPLVGGGEIHDWNWLLSRAGLLAHGERLALFLHGVASLGVVACTALAWREAFARGGAADAAAESSRFEAFLAGGGSAPAASGEGRAPRLRPPRP